MHTINHRHQIGKLYRKRSPKTLRLQIVRSGRSPRILPLIIGFLWKRSVFEKCVHARLKFRLFSLFLNFNGYIYFKNSHF